MVSQQVGQAYYGQEVQRLPRDGEDVRVMVRYPELARQSIGDLENMRVRTPNGDEVPFSTVARASMVRPPSRLTLPAKTSSPAATTRGRLSPVMIDSSISPWPKWPGWG